MICDCVINDGHLIQRARDCSLNHDGPAYTPRMAKRQQFKSGGYSREFTPAKQGHKRYLLDLIPVPFWKEVQAKAKREKVSIRALILRLLDKWLRE